jgi:hypothetical protein
MVASRARWQLVSSFNDWADGTAVEPASEWASPSGFGHYLDALRANGEPPQDNPAVLAAAGDIACDPTDPNFNDGAGHDDADNTKDACMAGRTADVVLALDPSLVLPLDDQYERGQLGAFDVSYAPTWGRFKSISRPVLGNHEYTDPAGGAAGYFDYSRNSRRAPLPASGRRPVASPRLPELAPAHLASGAHQGRDQGSAAIRPPPRLRVTSDPSRRVDPGAG